MMIVKEEQRQRQQRQVDMAMDMDRVVTGQCNEWKCLFGSSV